MDRPIGLLDSQHYENCRVSNVGYAGLRDCTVADLETSHHTLIYPLPFDNKFSPRDIVPVMTYANRAQVFGHLVQSNRKIDILTLYAGRTLIIRLLP